MFQGCWAPSDRNRACAQNLGCSAALRHTLCSCADARAGTCNLKLHATHWPAAQILCNLQTCVHNEQPLSECLPLQHACVPCCHAPGNSTGWCTRLAARTAQAARTGKDMQLRHGPDHMGCGMVQQHGRADARDVPYMQHGLHRQQ